MSNKKYKIKYEKERVLLADILPYEVPLFFSNRRFYDFLSKYNANKIFQKQVPDFLKINLLGLKKNTVAGTWSIDELSHTVPFHFKISHKENHPRILSIIHPSNQIKVTEFYHKYKDLIIYYGSRSNFSLRKIHSISSEEYHDDELHRKLYAEKESVEESSKEYKSVSSFFTYEQYSIIYKFFESDLFHKQEKKFLKMSQTDISRCFDQVYTHSFSWAIFGKQFVKDNRPAITNGETGKNFVNEFDLLMQKMNYNETNGIVIGPEFSRIFAEIILQKIDNNIQAVLSEEYQLENKVDYSIHRYIDDYFIFYNHDKDLDNIKRVLVDKLQEYHFFINEAKTRYFKKPIITEETIAKNEIKELLKKEIIVEKDGEDFLIKLNPFEIKTKIKTIVHKNNLNYDNLLNYVFILFAKKIKKAAKLYKDNIEAIPDAGKNIFTEKIFKLYWDALDVIFFLYSTEPKVTQTIIISSIISDIVETTKLSNRKFEQSSEYVYKKIYDEVYFCIKLNSSKKWSRIETVYLLTILRELGTEYVLSDEFLKENLISDYSSMNYFEIISLLFYLHDKPNQKSISDSVIQIAKQKISDARQHKQQDSEIYLLMIDLLTNPQIELAVKEDILITYDPSLIRPEISKIIKFITKEDIGFTDWVNFNFKNSVKQKKRLRVY